MSVENYPRRKVFTVFFLCPFVLGFFAGIFKFFALLVHLGNNPRLLGEVRGLELILMPVVAPVIAQLAFLPPFLVFALIIAWVKVNRTSRNCMLVSVSGGFVATAWALLFVAAVVNHTETARLSDYGLEMATIFFGSVVACWVAARFFLPDELKASQLT